MSESLSELSSRLSSVEEKIDNLLIAIKSAEATRLNNTNIINNNFGIIDQKIDNINEKTNSIEKTIILIEEKIGLVDVKVGNLHNDTKKDFEDVKFELVKIQKITSYDEMYNNLTIASGGKK